MTQQERERLDRDGYVLLEDAMGPDLLRELRAAIHALFDTEGEQAGREFKTEANAQRLANLVNKGDVFRRAILLPRMIAGVRHVLGEDAKLSSLNARSADPHSDEGQPLHVDMSALPDERGYWVCNTVWLLDDFTAENGATRVVPGSHRWGQRPQEVLADPMAPHPDEVLVLGRAGSIAVMNAHTWHGGTANRTDRPRRAMHAFYGRRSTPPLQNQTRLLDPEVQAGLTPELRALLALDDPLNDELSATVAVKSGFMK
jgi:ectoine hydroxylase-related dioxygenase (phytanoyl-CoA dioxygenase family)